MEGSWQNIVRTVKIGDHEVKPMGNLIPLEKKPLGSYFEGTKGKNTGKKRKKRITKPHKLKQNMSDFMLECDQNGVEMCSESSLPIIIPTMTAKQLEKRVQEYVQMKQYNDRKCHRKQKLMEENYIKEQEKLAETWKKYFYEKQLNDSQPKSPCTKTCSYRTRYYFRNQQFSNDDKDQREKEELSLEWKSGQNQSSCDDLDQCLEKLMIVEQSSMKPDSQQTVGPQKGGNCTIIPVK